MTQSAIKVELKLAICTFILMVLTMWTYYGSTANSFVWDSSHYLFNYVQYFAEMDWESFKWMATSLEFYNWHPMTWFSWAIDYQVYGGLTPWGFHFSSNVLHAFNSLILFFLILMIFGFVFPVTEKFSIRTDTNSLISALLASLMFALHPQHVESVAWVAERKDLLFLFFLMLTLISYMKYVTCPKVVKTKYYLLTLGLFFLGVLSKPMAVTLPVVLLLMDVYPLCRSPLGVSDRRLVKTRSYSFLLIEKLPFFFLSFLLAFLTIAAQKTAVIDVSLFARTINAIHSVFLYLEKFFIPIALNPHYPFFKVFDLRSAIDAILLAAGFVAITVAAVLAWKKHKQAWLIAWLFYLVTLSPVLGIIQVGSQGAADRYTYFPLLSVYLLLAYGLYLALKNGKPIHKAILGLSAVTVIFVFAVQTRAQIKVWNSELTLWTHVAELDPDNKLAQNNLGITYKNMGNYEKAIIHFEAGGEQMSGPDSMLAWRATTYMHLGRYQESIADLVKLGESAESRPELIVDVSCIQYNIGWNFAHLGMTQEAKDLFGRIDQSAELSSNAVAWKNALMMADQGTEIGGLGQKLPGICEYPIPSRANTHAARQQI